VLVYCELHHFEMRRWIGRQKGLSGQGIKRLVDIVGATIMMVILSPVAVICAALIYLRMGPPIVFRQWRPGIGERPFCLYKFRTMSPAEADRRSDGERITPLGRSLRRMSLDELPTLWNVLRGDMSLVGPRPLLMRYLPYFTEEERVRFTLRPGITGLAQIRGRNRLAWSARLASDVEYVNNRSLRLDLQILWRTAGQVVRGHGVVEDASSIMSDLDEERAEKGQPDL
jgi:lipopolysaccharide/colanic/teichoic acid biosynthesis glycosyltransferase